MISEFVARGLITGLWPLKRFQLGSGQHFRIRRETAVTNSSLKRRKNPKRHCGRRCLDTIGRG
jgi:hypothetical protein